MKTRIVHIALAMTLVIGVFSLNIPKAEAGLRELVLVGATVILDGKGPREGDRTPPPPTPTAPGSPGPPPPRPPGPQPPRRPSPPTPKPNRGTTATRLGRSLVGRVVNGQYIRTGGTFIARGLKVLGPIAIFSLAADGGQLLAAGVNAMERDADRVMAQNVATAEDRYRNPGKYGDSGRFNAPPGSFQSLYNATRPY